MPSRKNTTSSSHGSSETAGPDPKRPAEGRGAQGTSSPAMAEPVAARKESGIGADSESGSPSATEMDSSEDVRVRRIQEYLKHALGHTDALEANVGAVNADLMRISHRLAQAIHEAIDAGPSSLEDFEGIIPAVDNLLRLDKQIDRFTALEQRLAAFRSATALRSVGQTFAKSTGRVPEMPKETEGHA